MAFDAAAIPFADKGIDVVRTHLRLQNLSDPSVALRELRRVTRGSLFAVCQFVSDYDPNLSAMQGSNDLSMFTAEACLTPSAAWLEADVEHELHPRAVPTPVGKLVEGARIDGFPVFETDLAWRVLVAR